MREQEFSIASDEEVVADRASLGFQFMQREALTASYFLELELFMQRRRVGSVRKCATTASPCSTPQTTQKQP